MNENNRLETDPNVLYDRFNTLVAFYNDIFIEGLDDKYKKSIFLSKELLHCAVNAYFDDINKYKAFSGAKRANCHKQAAFTMIWIERFKPIQIVKTEESEIDTVLMSINEAFAISAGLMFLDEKVSDKMTGDFYHQLLYTLMYRSPDCKVLSTMMYLMEKLAQADVEF